MALNSYTPVLLTFFDDIVDMVIPTGTTASNPGGLTSPTLTGSPDSYADFDGADGISFLPTVPVGEVTTGDVTYVMRARVDTFTASDIIAENYDGSGTSGSAHGVQFVIQSGANRTVAMLVPPRSSGFRLETSASTLVAGQDFIIAFRRSGGTWTLWLDADATGGMTQDTPSTNAIGSSSITECGDITFGCGRTGSTPFDGRIYWIAGFNAAISDADLQLADWTTESNLVAAWVSDGNDYTLTVDHGSAVFSNEVVNLISTSSVVMPVTPGFATFEAQELPFILTQSHNEGHVVAEGSEINIIFANTFTLGVDHGSAVMAGQSIALNASWKLAVDHGQAVFSPSDVALTTPFILGDTTRTRHRAARGLLNNRR